MYASPHIIRVIKLGSIKWAGHVARVGDMRNTHRILVGKSQRKRPFGRPRCRWEDNIR